VSERPLVRASDIGLWAFCHRAWWLARVRGVDHQRPALLVRGTVAHQTHGHTVLRAQRQMRWGWGLLALGMIVTGLILLLGAMQGLL
jgi:hypothetical protein